jgi:tetratricopeptide (TPR) repeat protein
MPTDQGVDLRRRLRSSRVGAGLSTVLAVVVGCLINVATSTPTWSVALGLITFAAAWVGLDVWRAASDSRVHPSAAGPGTSVRRGSLDPPIGARPPNVRGREELIAALRHALGTPDGSVHVISGLGGTGKTAVALEMAERARSNGVRVWWLTARDQQTLTIDLLDLLAGLGTAQREIQQALSGVRSLIDLLWQRLEEHAEPWLLVVDNVDEPELLAAEGSHVSDGNGIVRGSRRGLVLLTSRVGSSAIWGACATVHRIGPLTTDVAATVLIDLAPDAGDGSDATALAEMLGGFPLALRHAGRYLNSAQARLDGIGGFAAYRRALGDASVHNATDSLPPQAQLVLEAAWAVSLDLLTRQGRSESRPLMRLLGGFAAAPLPLCVLSSPAWPSLRKITAAFRHLTHSSGLVNSALALVGRRHTQSVSADQDTIGALCDLGMLELEIVASGEEGIHCLTSHPMVTESNAAWLTQHPKVHRQVQATIIAMLAAATQNRDPHDAANYQFWPLLVPHVTYALASATTVSLRDKVRLLGTANATSWGLARAGHALAALNLAMAAADACRLWLPDDHPQYLDARHHIATALHELRRDQDAVREFTTLLPLRVRVLGEDHQDTLSSRMNYAVTLWDQGRSGEAEVQLRAVYEAHQRVLGGEARATLLSGANLAEALAERGCYEEAEELFRRILSSQCRTLGESHSNTLGTLRSIAAVLTWQGRFREAEAQYRAMLPASHAVLGSEHPWTLDAEQGLGEVLVESSKFEAADRVLQTVVAARARVLGEAHPDTLNSRYWSAELAARCGQRHEALTQLSAVLVDLQRALGPLHPDTERTHNAIQRLEYGPVTVPPAD